MLKRLPGIGLDIGSRKIKIIEAVRRKGRLEIIKFGNTITPPGTVESGTIVDPERLGEELKVLVNRLNISGKRVISAVGGQQLYIRNLIMPRMKPEEMKTAVYYQAARFLPVPLEDAAIAISPLREFEDWNGRKTEVFFLAVRKQSVDNLEMTCRIAGLKLAAVEIEPLSLWRAWGKDAGSVSALLSVGSSRSYITVFNRGVPVLYRSIAARSTTGPNGFNQSRNIREAVQDLDQDGRQADPSLREIVTEVKSVFEYYQMQVERAADSIGVILLCGGIYSHGLQEELSRELNVRLEVLDIITDNIMPRKISRNEEYELQHDFPLALGLAARGTS